MALQPIIEIPANTFSKFEMTSISIIADVLKQTGAYVQNGMATAILFFIVLTGQVSSIRYT
jgi:hypothetical protein